MEKSIVRIMSFFIFLMSFNSYVGILFKTEESVWETRRILVCGLLLQHTHEFFCSLFFGCFFWGSAAGSSLTSKYHIHHEGGGVVWTLAAAVGIHRHTAAILLCVPVEIRHSGFLGSIHRGWNLVFDIDVVTKFLKDIRCSSLLGCLFVAGFTFALEGLAATSCCGNDCKFRLVAGAGHTRFLVWYTWNPANLLHFI